MIPLLIGLFVIGPIAEIYVLLAAGGAFGVWPVVGACVATAVIGLDEGRAPVEAVADGVFLVIAAPFLMTPGFITDAIGFLLLIPPVRRAIAREALRRLRRNIETGETRVYYRRF